MKIQKLQLNKMLVLVFAAVAIFLLGVFVGIRREGRSQFKTSFPLIYCTGYALLPDEKYYKCVDTVREWDLDRMLEAQN